MLKHYLSIVFISLISLAWSQPKENKHPLYEHGDEFWEYMDKGVELCTINGYSIDTAGVVEVTRDKETRVCIIKDSSYQIIDGRFDRSWFRKYNGKGDIVQYAIRRIGESKPLVEDFICMYSDSNRIEVERIKGDTIRSHPEIDSIFRDDNGRIVRRAMFYGGSVKGVYTDYEYNEYGKISAKTTSGYKVGRIEYTYDTLQRLYRKTICNGYKNCSSRELTKYLYKYDGRNNLIEKQSSGPRSFNGYYRYAYDAANRVIFEGFYNYVDEPQSTIEWKYQADGRLISCTTNYDLESDLIDVWLFNEKELVYDIQSYMDGVLVGGYFYDYAYVD